MEPQIIGTKKSSDFRACERWCRERNISFHHRDPLAKPLSPGELQALVAAGISAEELIDHTSPAYSSRGFAWMEFDALEEIQQDPRLLSQPIVRTDAGAAVRPDSATLTRLFK